MKTKLLGVVLMAWAVFGCQDSTLTPKEPCEREGVGTLKINNTSNNPYDIYVDGKLVMRLDGKQFAAGVKVLKGNRVLGAKQVSGYLVYPTEVSTSKTITVCNETPWQIP